MITKPLFMRQNGKANIARSYRLKHGMEMKTAKLAELMLKENPDTFKNKEDARYHLRYIEGKVGKRANKAPNSVKKSEFYMATPRSSTS